MRNEKWIVISNFVFGWTQNERAPYIPILNMYIFIYIRALCVSLSLSLLLSLTLSVAFSLCFSSSSLSLLHTHTHKHYKKASPTLVGFFGKKSRDLQSLKAPTQIVFTL